MSSLSPIGATLGAPIRIGGQAVGVLAIYSSRSHDWNHEEFRLAEWLSEQCSRVLQAQRAQDALREADQRKSEFLATLSHELRNPLAPIRFALKLIEQGQTHGNAVRIMDRQFQQLVRLVDELLDATRLSSNKIQLRKKRSDLIAIVQQAWKPAGRTSSPRGIPCMSRCRQSRCGWMQTRSAWHKSSRIC